MKRNISEERRKMYQKNIVVKKIKSIFFWHTCPCCGNEFKNEQIYKCSYPISYRGYISADSNTKYGCTDCFQSSEEFKNYLFTEGYLDKTYRIHRED